MYQYLPSSRPNVSPSVGCDVHIHGNISTDEAGHGSEKAQVEPSKEPLQTLVSREIPIWEFPQIGDPNIVP